MAAAEVGDEQRGEDPTVNVLCERVATLLGKRAAVFLPSGTRVGGCAVPGEGSLPTALSAGVRGADHQFGRRPGMAAAAGRRTEVAARHRLRTHLDGARLLNAVVASGVAAADWARGFDTAWIDFTKGLGAPVDAVFLPSGFRYFWR